MYYDLDSVRLYRLMLSLESGRDTNFCISELCSAGLEFPTLLLQQTDLLQQNFRTVDQSFRTYN